METVRKKQKTGLYLLVSALVVVAGAVLGTLGMVDYYGAGVLTVFIFYFFHGHGRKWWCLLGQLAALYWVNVELLAVEEMFGFHSSLLYGIEGHRSEWGSDGRTGCRTLV